MKIKKFLTKATAGILSLSIAVGGACVLSNGLIAEADQYEDGSSFMQNLDTWKSGIDGFIYDEENQAYLIKEDDSVCLMFGCEFDTHNFINYGEIFILNYGTDMNLKNIVNYGTIIVEEKYTGTATILESITNYGTITDPNSKISGNIININAIKNPATAGDTTVTLNGSTIPEPTYTVTIPTEIAFGDVAKTLESADDRYATTNFDVKTTLANFSENEKELVVTMSSDFKLANGENELTYAVYNKADTTFATPLKTGTTLDINNSLDTSNNYFTARLDQSQIKVAGDYAGTVTFTVAMQDK